VQRDIQGRGGQGFKAQQNRGHGDEQNEPHERRKLRGNTVSGLA
jgi:hypothetical protein